MAETITHKRASGRTNMRKALAGLNYLKGMSAAQAIEHAGFAPSTAKKPASNGLTANRCIDEAVKVWPEVNPSTLVAKARRAFGNKLQDVIDGKAKNVRLGELARAVDVAERHYGGDSGTIDDARRFGTRLAWLCEVLSSARDAQPILEGIVVDAAAAGTPLHDVVDSTGESTPDEKD